MGSDGREGAAWIKAKGGAVLTESEESCVVRACPGRSWKWTERRRGCAERMADALPSAYDGEDLPVDDSGWSAAVRQIP
jgi:hypothetical protein